MKDRKQKQPDDEIEAEVLARLGDASAWDVLPSVPPSSSPRPDWVRAASPYKVGALQFDPAEGLEPSCDPITPPERERNGVPLLPQRPKESQRPDMERINHLRDEK